MQHFLTFDVGTTSMKCILFDEQFNEVFYENKEYDIKTGPGGLAELEAEVYFDTFCACIQSLVAKDAKLPAQIASITFTTQGETMIPVDEAGNALLPAIVWLDTRAEQEAGYIKEQISQAEFYRATGLCEADGALPAAKVLWLQKHQPDVYEKTHKILLLEDYLIFRLTGEMVSEKSLQSSTGWYDIVNDTLFDKLLTSCSLDKEKFPRILPCGTVVGNILPSVAEELGLSGETVVVTGAMDQIASAIGAGNIKEGIVTETTGTALVVGATVLEPAFDIENPVTVYKHFDNSFIYMPYSGTAGIVLKWFRDTVMPETVKLAKEKNMSSYGLLDEMAKTAPAGSNGIIMNPDFTNGGGFYGLTLATTREDLVRSVLEGVAYMLRDLIECVIRQGVAVEQILSLGGGSYSDIWSAIKASVCGKQICCVDYSQTTALGAAVLASVALGVFADAEEATRAIRKNGKTFLPNADEQAVYNEAYIQYKSK